MISKVSKLGTYRLIGLEALGLVPSKFYSVTTYIYPRGRMSRTAWPS